MDLYTEAIIDLAKNPLNRKPLAEATHSATGVNTTCGDHVRLYLVLGEGLVKEASWEGDGCAISIASASVLTEELKGKRLEEVNAFDKDTIMKLMEIPTLGPARVKCLTLSVETLKNALLSSTC